MRNLLWKREREIERDTTKVEGKKLPVFEKSIMVTDMNHFPAGLSLLCNPVLFP